MGDIIMNNRIDYIRNSLNLDKPSKNLQEVWYLFVQLDILLYLTRSSVQSTDFLYVLHSVQ